MLTANAADLPDVLVRELRHQFVIPQAAIRVWGGAEAFAALSFARGVDDDVRSFAASLARRTAAPTPASPRCSGSTSRRRRCRSP